MPLIHLKHTGRQGVRQSVYSWHTSSAGEHRRVDANDVPGAALRRAGVVHER